MRYKAWRNKNRGAHALASVATQDGPRSGERSYRGWLNHDEQNLKTGNETTEAAANKTMRSVRRLGLANRPDNKNDRAENPHGREIQIFVNCDRPHSVGSPLI